MQRGAIYSAVLHLVIALLVIFGLPQFFDREELADQPMIVDVVTIAEKTNPPPAKPREEPPKPKPVEDKPPPPEAKPQPAPTPPPVPEPPQPQLAEKIPDPKPPEPKPPEKIPEPEPKPEPKPEVKKEPPKPPEPPQQMAKVVPPKKPTPPQKQPKKEDFIDSILKNVAPTPKVAEKSETKTPQKDTAPQSPAPPSLDQQVTISEIDAVKRQISECWSPPAGARDAKDLVVTIRATVAPDGRVQTARIENSGRMGDPFFRAAAESAQRAVLNPRCQPLKLPPHKYEQWRNLRLDFNPKDMIG